MREKYTCVQTSVASRRYQKIVLLHYYVAGNGPAGGELRKKLTFLSRMKRNPNINGLQGLFLNCFFAALPSAYFDRDLP